MKLFFIKKIILSMLNPAPAPFMPGFIKSIAKRPRIFAFIILVAQWLDLKRQTTIKKDYVINDEYYKKVQDYNADVTLKKIVTTTRRAEELFQVIVLPPRNIKDEKLLLIGPRNIQELIMAWVYGFTWKNIEAIDLYSTNQKITVMNMEDMKFDDGLFDAVLMANTFAYAKQPDRLLSEISRVIKPGGKLVFGATFLREETEFYGNRIRGNEIKRILDKLPLDIYYYNPIDKINASGNSQTIHLLGLVKNINNIDEKVDRIEL